MRPRSTILLEKPKLTEAVLAEFERRGTEYIRVALAEVGPGPGAMVQLWTGQRPRNPCRKDAETWLKWKADLATRGKKVDSGINLAATLAMAVGTAIVAVLGVVQLFE